MICGCGMASVDSNPILDLHRAVEEYAWREFKHCNSFLSGVLVRRSDFTIDVPWDFFEFDHHTTKFNPRHSSTDGFVEKNVVTLCSATFTNETRVKQVYKFRSNRSTKAVTNITFQRGFTINGSANFVLTVPKQFGDFGVRDSFDGQFKVSRCYGETFEEEFHWDIDNDITVEKHHVTEAKMVITEDELIADFEVRTTIRMPTSNAPIEIRRRGSDDMKTTILIHDLSDVFNQFKGHNMDIIKVTDNRKASRYDVEITTVGVIRSTRWRDRRITLTSKSLRQPSLKSATSRTPLLQESFSFDSDDILTRVLRHATLTPHPQIPPVITKGDYLQPSAASASPREISRGIIRERDNERERERERETKVLFPTIIPNIVADLPKTDDTIPLLETSVNETELPPPPPQVDVIPDSDTEPLPEVFPEIVSQDDHKSDTVSETSSLHKLFSLHAQATLESDGGFSASSDATVLEISRGDSLDVSRDTSRDGSRHASFDAPDVVTPKGILVTSKRGASKLSKVTSV